MLSYAPAASVFYEINAGKQKGYICFRNNGGNSDYIQVDEDTSVTAQGDFFLTIGSEKQTGKWFYNRQDIGILINGDSSSLISYVHDLTYWWNLAGNVHGLMYWWNLASDVHNISFVWIRQQPEGFASGCCLSVLRFYSDAADARQSIFYRRQWKYKHGQRSLRQQVHSIIGQRVYWDAHIVIGSISPEKNHSWQECEKIPAKDSREITKDKPVFPAAEKAGDTQCAESQRIIHNHLRQRIKNGLENKLQQSISHSGRNTDLWPVPVADQSNKQHTE